MNLIWPATVLFLSGAVLLLIGFVVKNTWHPALWFLWLAGASAGTATLTLLSPEARLLWLPATVFLGLGAIVIPILTLLHNRIPMPESKQDG